MKKLSAFLESGLLELYILGACTEEERRQVQRMADENPEVCRELEVMEQAMEHFARTHALEPNNLIKPIVVSTIDYLERMKQGELPSSPPLLSSTTLASDFASWLNRPDMVLPADAGNIHAKIIGYTPKATTAIIWIRHFTDPEVHHDEQESFLILEGTCHCTVGEIVYTLGPGDYFKVPLHQPHHVRVTSAEPCKAILQRVSDGG